MPKFEVTCTFSVAVEAKNSQDACDKVEADLDMIDCIGFPEVWNIEATEIE